MGFVILLRLSRWVFFRLLLSVRAVFGFCEVGVLGLEREGISVRLLRLGRMSLRV